MSTPLIQLANPDKPFSAPPCQSLVLAPVENVPTIDFRPYARASCALAIWNTRSSGPPQFAAPDHRSIVVTALAYKGRALGASSWCAITPPITSALLTLKVPAR